VRRRGCGSGAALLAAAVVLGAASLAAAQAPGEGGVTRSRARTLGQRESEETQLGFAQLVDRHVRYRAGGLERLPAAPGDGAPQPGVYVTVTAGAALVYDRVAAKLDRGAFAPAAVAGCVAAGAPGRGADVSRAVRCVPTLRAAATRALAEEAARLRAHGVAEPPRALIAADQALPFATFLQAAYAVALGTAGAPPPLHLLVRSGGRVAAVPFFLVPPRVVRLDRGLTPLILVVRLAGGRLSVETSSHFSVGRRTPVANLAALDRVVGELRARDPDRTVAFLTADRRTALGEVVAVMAALRGHYPNVVLGESGPSFTQGGRPRGRHRE
jgi:hypothetical protein